MGQEYQFWIPRPILLFVLDHFESLEYYWPKKGQFLKKTSKNIKTLGGGGIILCKIFLFFHFYKPFYAFDRFKLRDVYLSS
jgi:hypothetical protein